MRGRQESTSAGATSGVSSEIAVRRCTRTCRCCAGPVSSARACGISVSGANAMYFSCSFFVPCIQSMMLQSALFGTSRLSGSIFIESGDVVWSLILPPFDGRTLVRDAEGVDHRVDHRLARGSDRAGIVILRRRAKPNGPAGVDAQGLCRRSQTSRAAFRRESRAASASRRRRSIAAVFETNRFRSAATRSRLHLLRRNRAHQASQNSYKHLWRRIGIAREAHERP